MRPSQPRKRTILSTCVAYEPTRLEAASLQAAYEQIVPIVRRTRVEIDNPSPVEQRSQVVRRQR